MGGWLSGYITSHHITSPPTTLLTLPLILSRVISFCMSFLFVCLPFLCVFPFCVSSLFVSIVIPLYLVIPIILLPRHYYTTNPTFFLSPITHIILSHIPPSPLPQMWGTFVELYASHTSTPPPPHY